MSDRKIFHMHLPDNVHFILDKLNSAGYEAVVVGGCVRDVLLGKEPHDYDIATSAFPEEIMGVFNGDRMILDGLKHGTVTVIYDHVPYEITTYRIDGKYTDHRRPDNVEFTRNLRDDLSRRDFTINALAYDRDYIYDFFDGMDDIEHKVIRCVGNPADRISEDPLRIMRALRFSAQYGFVIDEDTSKVILNDDNIKLLEMIAQERKSAEFNKLLGGDNIVMVFWQYFPIIRSLYSGFMLIDNPFETAMKIRDSMNLYEGIAILCEDMSIDLFKIDEEVDFLCKAMRYSNQIKKNVVEIIKVWKKELLFPGEICARHLLYKYQFANAISGIRCKIIEFEITSLQKEKSVLILHLNELINTINSIEENKEDCHSIRALAVGGHELKAIGITDKDVGKWLNTLTELVMNGAVDNNSVDLLNIVLLNS